MAVTDPNLKAVVIEKPADEKSDGGLVDHCGLGTSCSGTAPSSSSGNRGGRFGSSDRYFAEPAAAAGFVALPEPVAGAALPDPVPNFAALPEPAAGFTALPEPAAGAGFVALPDPVPGFIALPDPAAFEPAALAFDPDPAAPEPAPAPPEPAADPSPALPEPLLPLSTGMVGSASCGTDCSLPSCFFWLLHPIKVNSARARMRRFMERFVRTVRCAQQSIGMPFECLMPPLTSSFQVFAARFAKHPLDIGPIRNPRHVPPRPLADSLLPLPRNSSRVHSAMTLAVDQCIADVGMFGDDVPPGSDAHPARQGSLRAQEFGCSASLDATTSVSSIGCRARPQVLRTLNFGSSSSNLAWRVHYVARGRAGLFGGASPTFAE